MKISIRLTAAFVPATEGKKKLSFEIEDGASLSALMTLLFEKYPALRDSLCDSDFRLADRVNMYINGDNVRYLDGFDTRLKDDDEVFIILAAAAG